MAWPAIDEFRNAIIHPQNLVDADLRSGTLATNKRGLPKSWAGGLALTFRIDVANKAWAVRTFKYQTDHLKTYELISKALAGLSPKASKYFVDFGYQPQGIVLPKYKNDPLNPYPIVKMEWVDGEQLDQWVAKNLKNKNLLRKQAEKWREMILCLTGAGIAHGDLQQGNVLVTGSSDFKLIDYDGLYVPSMRGWQAREIGHPNWNHPARDTSLFGKYLDQFTGFVGYLSLHALSQEPSLFNKYYNGDNLILGQRDLATENLGITPVYSDLRKMNRPIDGGLSVADMVENLTAWATAQIDSMHLEEAISKKRAQVHTGTIYVVPKKLIIIKTNPAGAMVMIDGVAYGQTDIRTGELRAYVQSKKSRIEISCPPAYEPLPANKQVLDLTKAQTRQVLEFQLKPLPPVEQFVIRTRPLNAEVIIDGDSCGYTVPGGLSIPKEGFPPSVNLHIKAPPGYKDHRQTLKLKDIKAPLDFTLTPARGSSVPVLWSVFNSIGVVLGLLALNQLAGSIHFAKWWGVFSFSGAAVGAAVYALLSTDRSNWKGASLLMMASTMCTALIAPEIVYRLPDLDPGDFHRSVLAGNFGARYATFLVGFWAAWSIAKSRVRRRVGIHIGMLLVFFSALLPSLVLSRFFPHYLSAHTVSWLPSIAAGYSVGLCAGWLLAALPPDSVSTASPKWARATMVAGMVLLTGVGFCFYRMNPKDIIVDVNTTPPGVSVYSGNSLLGTTDGRGHLSLHFFEAGRLHLTFAKPPDFAPKSLNRYVSEDISQTPLRVSLRRIRSDLVFQTGAPNAEIYLDGKSHGYTDSRGYLQIKAHKVGRVSYCVRKPGYSDVCGKTVVSRENAATDVKVTMQPLAGTLELLTNCQGAEVVVDGKSGTTDNSGNLTLAGLPVDQPLGIRVQKEGWTTWHRQAVVTFSKDNLTVKMPIELQRKQVFLKVKAGPEGAKIIVDGEDWGEVGSSGSITIPGISLGITKRLEIIKEPTHKRKEFRLSVPESFEGETYVLDAGTLEELLVPINIRTSPTAVEIFDGDKRIAVSNKDSGLVEPPLGFKRGVTKALVAKKPGYEDKGFEVQADLAGDYFIELERIVARLQVQTDPGGVEVFLNGKHQGTTGANGSLDSPVSGVPCEVANTVKFTKDGYRDEEITVTIPADFRNELYEHKKIVLKLNPVMVSIQTNPPTAEVKVIGENGDEILKKRSDSDGALRVELSPGKYELRCSKHGYLQGTVATEIDKTNPVVSIVLKEDPMLALELACNSGQENRVIQLCNDMLKNTGLKDDKQQHSYLLFRRGISHYNIGNLNKALNDLKQVTKLDPSNHESFRFIGNIYFKDRQYKQALSFYEKGLAVERTKTLLWNAGVAARRADLFSAADDYKTEFLTQCCAEQGMNSLYDPRPDGSSSSNIGSRMDLSARFGPDEDAAAKAYGKSEYGVAASIYSSLLSHEEVRFGSPMIYNAWTFSRGLSYYYGGYYLNAFCDFRAILIENPNHEKALKMSKSALRKIKKMPGRCR